MDLRIIFDAEFNKLNNPDTLHCIVCRDVDSDQYWVFENDDPKSFNNFSSFCRNIDVWIGHNCIDFDSVHLSRLIKFELPRDRCIDTLIVSRLVNYNIEGGHSVEAWAKRLKLPDQKIQIQDFNTYTPELRNRCISDTKIQKSIFLYLEKYINHPAFKKALRLEHDIQWICNEIRDNGFPFDINKAKELHSSLSQQLEKLDEEIKEAFPPIRVLKETIRPRVTKSGTIHAIDFRKLCAAGFSTNDITADKDYEIYETEEFNPASIKQIIERLWDAGWKPTEKTKGHAEATGRNSSKDKESLERLERFRKYGWKLSEENLRSLPESAPEGARKLTERLLVASRVSDLDEWINLCTVTPEASRIHGNFNGIGGWTHRLSTQKPNMQNIPVPQHIDNPKPLDTLSDKINSEMRTLWTAEKDCVLVGTDADGIQMRIFAHYVNDERLINALVKGDKKSGTDIHTIHWKALGTSCKGRNPAKTFIYAWLLGAGVGKVSEILECGTSEARESIDNFIRFYPGLSDLKQGRIPRDAERGYFEGLDGRLVPCPDEHRILAGYLQNGEAVIMKTAINIWTNKLKRDKIYYKLHTWPHDEWQTSVRPDEAEEVGKIQADSIREAGEILKLNLPLSGQYKIGRTWLDTH